MILLTVTRLGWTQTLVEDRSFFSSDVQLATVVTIVVAKVDLPDWQTLASSLQLAMKVVWSWFHGGGWTGWWRVCFVKSGHHSGDSWRLCCLLKMGVAAGEGRGGGCAACQKSIAMLFPVSECECVGGLRHHKHCHHHHQQYLDKPARLTIINNVLCDSYFVWMDKNKLKQRSACWPTLIYLTNQIMKQTKK